MFAAIVSLAGATVGADIPLLGVQALIACQRALLKHASHQHTLLER